MTATQDVTQLLLAWQKGDRDAADRLMPLIYGELQRLAQHYMDDERSSHTLQATALVHEAYARLVGLDSQWEGRGHFFAMAAKLMRRILIDHGRRRSAGKRGGAEPAISLDDAEAAYETSTDLLDLNAALEELESFDPRRAKILELRFFGGLTLKETAEVMGSSSATVERELKLAKAWLNRKLDP